MPPQLFLRQQVLWQALALLLVLLLVHHRPIDRSG
jgi:hypothetical protein